MITPFKNFRSPKILPTIYDESLSYYEVLCKIDYKLNEVIDQVNNIRVGFKVTYDAATKTAKFEGIGND